MRFLIAGSSGFLGSLLSQHLTDSGHHVTALVRRAPSDGEVRWDPYAAPLGTEVVDNADVVVNLAGSPTVGNPHSEKWARTLRESRVTTTRVLAEAIAGSERKPAFLAGNGISYYGDHGDTVLTEDSDSRGHALLTEVTRDWQAAAQPAVDAGARVCFVRTSPVLDRRSEPLHALSLLFKSGLAGPLGNGKQYFPVISARDWVRAVAFLAETDTVSGPVNLVLPEVSTNEEFTRALGRQVHRPALLKVPAPLIKLGASRMAPEVLGSVRARPQVLLDAGFAFEDRTIDEVLTTGLATSRS